MKTMKVMIFCFLLSVVMAIPFKKICAFQNEPQGFRGIAWETNIDDIQGLDLKDQRMIKDYPLSVYTKDPESLSYAQVKLKDIRYVFYKKQFFMVHLVANSRSRYKAIKKYLHEKFGEPTAAFNKQDRFFWEGEKTTISIRYKIFPKRTVVSFYYKPIGKTLE